MPIDLNRQDILRSLAIWLVPAVALAARAAPTAQQALELKPVQRDVDFDLPSGDELAKCTIKPEKIGGRTGWIVRDAAGQPLRCFLDSNGDDVVDQWRYFKEGIEVYRDIDSNFNNKADQYRWLGAGGMRWGLDPNEDGKIDGWRMISAEEVTAEVVAAIKEGDAARFARLLLTPKELKSLGLGATKASQLAKKVEAAPAAFRELVAQQKLVTEASKWIYFGGSRPGVIPAGTADSTADITVYENVTAMIDTDGKPGQVVIGTLVKVNDAWRLIDAPQTPADGVADSQPHGFFYPELARKDQTPSAASGGPSKLEQELVQRLEAIDKEAAAAQTPAEQADFTRRRAEILLKLADGADTPERRTDWMRQLIDTVSAAAQAGGFPDGSKLLTQIRKGLKANGRDADLAAHADFCAVTIDYYQSLQQPGANIATVQADWLEQLKRFIKDHPGAPDSADALLQLGIAEEFAGNDQSAVGWYRQIERDHAGTAAARKAAGAATRLESVGKRLAIQGKTFDGGQVDLARMKDKVVLVHFWSTNAQPSMADLPILKDLLERYGKRDKGLAIVGINLDIRRADLDEFLKDNPLKWPQIFEGDGMDGRLASDLGIHTLPTMILIDRQGKVANRGVHAAELEKEIKELLAR